jgi:hypothetical protein
MKRNHTKGTKVVKSFKAAVEATPDVANCYQPGLRALGVHSSKITVASPALLNGSIDIDSCTVHLYPTENRWDYAFAYKGEVFFMEVHSAKSSEVRVMLKKLQWLKDWLQLKAPEINKIKSKSNEPFYWVQSKGANIPKGSPQYRAAINAGIKPVAKIVLV